MVREKSALLSATQMPLEKRKAMPRLGLPRAPARAALRTTPQAFVTQMTKRNSEVGIKMLNAVFQQHNWSPRSVLSRWQFLPALFRSHQTKLGSVV